MRRSRREETSHGTIAGQLPIDPRLRQRYALTQREAECASLLRHGVSAGDLASSLGVSPSTIKKHLAALRRKLAAASTEKLVGALQRALTDDNVAAHHSWPPAPVAPILHMPLADPSLGRLAARCRGRLHMLSMLEVLREFLAQPFRARYIFYVFSPLSVRGLLRDDVLWEAMAPAHIRHAYREAGRVLDTPSAQYLFTRPDGFFLVDGRSSDYDAAAPAVQRFYDACLQDGVRYGITFGFPSGAGFVGVSVSLHEDARDPEGLLNLHGELLRAAAMVVHNSAWTYGALAARYGLTVRERDALSLIAEGRSATGAAKELGISERTLSIALAGARRKLGARTNAEAVGKGAAANLLLFRE